MTSLTPLYRPVVDGYFLPRTPEELVSLGPLNAQSFLTGATRDEGLIAGLFVCLTDLFVRLPVRIVLLVYT